MRVSASRVKDPEVKARVIKFQRWAIETLGKVMDGKQAVPEHPATAALLEDHLRMAKALSEYAGVKPGIASAVAIATVEDRTGADLSWCRNLLPAAQQPPGCLIPTDIGVRLGVTPRHVNLLLEGLGYQTRISGDWRLIGAGRFWGEEYPFARNGHTGYQIKWKPEIVGKLEGVLHQSRQARQGLLIGELFG
jgi:hypothetical protein